MEELDSGNTRLIKTEMKQFHQTYVEMIAGRIVVVGQIFALTVARFVADVVAQPPAVAAAAAVVAAVARKTDASAGVEACFHTQPQLQRDEVQWLLQLMVYMCQQSLARYLRVSEGPASEAKGTDQGPSRGWWGRLEARPRPGDS